LPGQPTEENIILPFTALEQVGRLKSNLLTQIIMKKKIGFDENIEAKITSSFAFNSKIYDVNIWTSYHYWKMKKKVSSGVKLLIMVIASIIVFLSALSLSNSLLLDISFSDI